MIETRVRVDDGEMGQSVYPSTDARLWLTGAMPAKRARVERRLVLTLRLPWIPWRWHKR